MINELNTLHTGNDEYIFCWVLDSKGNSTNDTCLIKQGERGIEAEFPFNDNSQEILSWVGFREDGVTHSFGEVIIPKVIWVKNIKDGKTFALIDSRLMHKTTPLFAVRGYITIRPTYVIQGNEGMNYSEANTVRSVIRELVPWIGHGPLQSTYKVSKDGKGTLEAYNIGFEKQDPIIISDDDLELRFVPFGYFNERPFPFLEVTLQQDIAFESIAENVEGFERHLAIHRNLRTLLSVLLWGGVAVHSLSVKRDDDKEFDAGAKEIPAIFHPVATDRLEGWGKTTKDVVCFSFLYKDIGPEGLNRWFQLCEESPGITGRMYYLAANKNLSIETEFNDHGVLLEAIADTLNIDCPKSKKETYREKMIRIFDFLKDYIPLLSNSLDTSKAATVLAHSYNSLKHTAEKRGGMPREYWIDPENLMNLVVMCRALEILWLAMTLGCEPENVNFNPIGINMLNSAVEHISNMQGDESASRTFIE